MCTVSAAPQGSLTLVASFMKRAMVYLGLQDDDEHQYDQYGYS